MVVCCPGANCWAGLDEGYCQSMNFVAAALLSQLPAERAFWTFCSLVEDLLPHGYYTVPMQPQLFAHNHQEENYWQSGHSCEK
eukprot:3363073-Amphidinium_carterae.1